MAIQFGTDGWRAVISEDFTFANVKHVAQAIADIVREDGGSDPPSLVVGYDTRFLSDRYAATVASVLAANGIHVFLCERFAPTPVVSHAIVDVGADGGVMITASHNPPRYNGIKLKAAYGGSASPATHRRVEKALATQLGQDRDPHYMELDVARRAGLVDSHDPFPAYADHIRRLIDFDIIARSQMRIAIDAMYGAGIGYTDKLLREAGLEPITLHDEMNPGFGGLHPEPIEKHLGELCRMGRDHDFDLGLATDGDADRIGAVGPTGAFIDPHRIMTLALDYLLKQGQRGAVVKTVSTTQMLNLLAKRHNLPVHETPVGFNHIADLMMTQDVLIGGEESGGISIKRHIPEGDGVLMGLLLTELVAAQGGDAEALIENVMTTVGHFSYARHDFEVTPFSKADLVRHLVDTAPDRLAGRQVVSLHSRDGVKYVLEDDGWLLIRPSGTEPMLRVYAEARTMATVNELLTAGAELARQAQAQ